MRSLGHLGELVQYRRVEIACCSWLGSFRNLNKHFSVATRIFVTLLGAKHSAVPADFYSYNPISGIHEFCVWQVRVNCLHDLLPQNRSRIERIVDIFILGVTNPNGSNIVGRKTDKVAIKIIFGSSCLPRNAHALKLCCPMFRAGTSIIGSIMLGRRGSREN